MWYRRCIIKIKKKRSKYSASSSLEKKEGCSLLVLVGTNQRSGLPCNRGNPFGPGCYAVFFSFFLSNKNKKKSFHVLYFLCSVTDGISLIHLAVANWKVNQNLAESIFDIYTHKKRLCRVIDFLGHLHCPIQYNVKKIHFLYIHYIIDWEWEKVCGNPWIEEVMTPSGEGNWTLSYLYFVYD